MKDKNIQEIDFDGLINVHPDDIKPLLEIRQGGPLNTDLQNKSLKKLFSLDMFKNAKIDVSEGTNGAIVKFIVEENYYLRTVIFRGNDNISTEDLKKVISFTDSSYYTENKAAKSIAAIQKKYIDDGFRDVSVVINLKPVDVKKQTFDIEFKVTTGRKIVVEKINISGNNNVKTDEIKSVMKTKIVFFIFIDGVLKQKDFDYDREVILQLYGQKGYIDAQIKDFSWSIQELGTDKHKAIVVNLSLVEGEKYKTGKITITGNTLFTTPELQGLVDLKEGEIYDKVKMDNVRLRIFNRYSDDGHLYANISLLMNKDTTNRIVDSQLVIVEGQRTHIEHISVSGNTKTKLKVITRELEYQEGELYIQWKVKRSYERLMQTQFFDDVKPDYLPGDAEGLIDLDMSVQEARTGIVTFGVGYGTVSGFNLAGQISERNLGGEGRALTLRATVGTTADSAGISYEEPYLFDQPIFADVSLGYSLNLIQNVPADSSGTGYIDYTNINYIQNPNAGLGVYISSNEYWQQSFSLGLSLRRNLPDYWSVTGGVGTIVYQDFGANFSNPLIYTSQWETNTELEYALSAGWLFKNYLSLGFTRNSTDNPLRPLYGSIFNLSVTYYGGIMGGYAQFLKPTVSYAQYLSIPNPVDRLVLVLYGEADLLTPQFNQAYTYDYSDMLYFDGTYRLRGWGNLSTRGLSTIYWSGELRYEIYDPVWGVFFYDMGNIFQTYNGIAPFSPDGYLFSFGIGIQVNIMGLPIRVYVARRGEYNSYTQSFQLDTDNNVFDQLEPVLSIQGIF
ncbi:MAG: outer membrane protein assembly factor BamA [Brevinematales bacterium]|jgi:outer membrane protein insertion porin family